MCQMTDSKSDWKLIVKKCRMQTVHFGRKMGPLTVLKYALSKQYLQRQHHLLIDDVTN